MKFMNIFIFFHPQIFKHGSEQLQSRHLYPRGDFMSGFENVASIFSHLTVVYQPEDILVYSIEYGIRYH